MTQPTSVSLSYFQIVLRLPPERETVDFTQNMYGDSMIDFLLSSKCCVLNGRKDVCSNNDNTSISVKGLALVDYCLVPMRLFHTSVILRCTDQGSYSMKLDVWLLLLHCTTFLIILCSPGNLYVIYVHPQ